MGCHCLFADRERVRYKGLIYVLQQTENPGWSSPISIEFNMQIDLIKRRVMVVPVLPFLTACSSAPSRNILGSYFPSWMICVLIGVGLSIVVRWILVKLDMEKELPVPIVVHLAFAIAFSFAAWLLWLA